MKSEIQVVLGIMDRRVWFLNGNEPKVLMEEKINHGQYENQIRRQFGLPPRQTYGGYPLFPQQGETAREPNSNYDR